MDGPEAAAGMEALRRLKSTDAPLFLSPSEELAQAARVASKYLFSALKRFSSKSPLPHLVTEGFDAEQIWPQIEAQSEPSIKILRNQLRRFEKHPEEIEKQFNLVNFDEKDEKTKSERENDFLQREIEGFEGDEMEEDDKYDDEECEKDEDGEDGDEEEEGEGEGEDEDEEEEEKDEGNANGVEDKFFKIKELEKYLEEDEAREYGLKRDEKGKKKRKRGGDEGMDEDGEGEGEEEEEEEEEEKEEEEEDDDELGFMGLDDGEDDEEDGMENARFKDFFKKSKQKKASKFHDASDGLDKDDGHTNDNNNQQKKHNLSTYEKEQEKLRSQIEQMEKANLEPKDWTMQGEVTAAKRAKNSALEVDLDFEHNVRPAPVITEEVTASLEELIQKRILEGRFDDVQKPPTLLSRAPKEKKELDENKSKKGLAEVYEDEYVQKTGLVATALSFSDEQKKEASMLFKKLCLKLDALSHFHFTPKPVIEDMSIQANVPALAMEEIAPVAVSDAAMLAPEEVFAGKGDIKEETELTQAERKRRRAKKKRKFKVESVKRMAKKAQQSVLSKHAEGNEDS